MVSSGDTEPAGWGTEGQDAAVEATGSHLQRPSLGPRLSHLKLDSLGAASRAPAPLNRPPCGATPSLRRRVSRGPAASPAWAAPGHRSCPGCSCLRGPIELGHLGDVEAARESVQMDWRRTLPSAMRTVLDPPHSGRLVQEVSGTARRCTAQSGEDQA